MSSSFRSRFRNPSQSQDKPTSSIPRKPLPPPKPSASESKSSRAAQHVSNLAKRASRTFTATEKVETGARVAPAAPYAAPTVRASPVSSGTPVSNNGSTYSAPSSTRLNTTPNFSVNRTPSLVSGTTASTFDSPRGNGLRRKPSNIDRYASQRKTDQDGVEIDRSAVPSRSDDRVYDNTVFGIALPPTADYTSPFHSAGHDTPREWTPLGLPPSVASYAMTASPSTRYTDSPFSHAPTPSSVSSYSSSVAPNPVAIQQAPPENNPARSRIPSKPVEKSSTRTSHLGLPPVRESSTSSSNSTVKQAGGKHTRKEAPNKIPKPMSHTKSPQAPTTSTQARKHSQSSTTSQGTSVQIPPELAHLNVDPGPKPTPKSQTVPRPRRPSRDGTSALPDLMGPSPVVQSDLPRLYTTYHKRTSSQEVTPSSPSKSRFGVPTRTGSRRESPRIDSAITPPPSSGGFNSRVPTTVHDGRRVLRKDSPSLTQSSPNKSPSKPSRFGLFSRKSKTESPPVNDESTQRRHSKGPAAGTGHEGYGRFATRARSGSTASQSGARSPSVASSASGSRIAQPNTRRSSTATRRTSGAGSAEGSDMDEFLKERLRPVYLRGSGSTGSNFSNPAVSSSDLPDTAFAPSSTSTSLESYPTPQLLPSAMSESRGQSPAKRPPLGRRLHSNTSDAESDTLSWPDTDRVLQNGPYLAMDLNAQPKSKKNFVQRARTGPEGKGKAPAKIEDTQQRGLGVMVNGVAHYALTDPSQTVGLSDVERMLHDNETSADESAPEARLGSVRKPPHVKGRSLIPAAPKKQAKVPETRTKPRPPDILVRLDSTESPELLRAQTAIPQAQPAQVVSIQRSPSLLQREGMGRSPKKLSEDAAESSNDSPRQPRLSPVGRIPRVVSKRDRDRKLPDNSFSRPFARAQPRPAVHPPGALYNQIREHASPEPGMQTVTPTSANEAKGSTAASSSSVAPNRASIGYGYPYPGDFMSFAPRKGSDASFSSSNKSYFAALAAAPQQEEEPWTEYNDLIDDMLPSRTPLSTSSSFGAPFQYAGAVSKTNSPAIPPPLNLGSHPPTSGLPSVPLTALGGDVLSVPQQISQLLKPSLTSLRTTHTLSDFVDQYGNRNSEVLSSPDRSSMPPVSREAALQTNRTSIPSARCSVASSRHSRSSGHSRSASLPEANARNSQNSLLQNRRFSREAQLVGIAEVEHEERIKSNNLRSDALITSKWLVRGRVLFSPAHDNMSKTTEPRVLIIDGLGSDWSCYVALQYPNATVYNLGATTHNVQDSSLPDSSKQPPPNHRQIPHSSLDAAFPFPKGFFSAVVFRFPVATTNEAYHACMFECKRVLRPGGYLEVAILDLDFKNMGPLARKAVRNLKIRMQCIDKDVSLGNLSDVLVRMIGRRGFEEVQCCLLGVPVAGQIRRSADMSSVGSGPQSPESKRKGKQRQTTEATIPDNDEGMSKRAASVGRWWYSRCYEANLHNLDKVSIWNDRALLKECELETTNFRMLICHAQKPTQTQRRTVSL